MKWTTVKRAVDVPLKGIQVSFDERNGSLEAIILRQGDSIVKIAKHDYSLLSVLVPEVEKKHRLTAKVHGFAVVKEFDDKREAEQEHSELEGREGVEDLKLELVDVPSSTGNDIPF